MAVNMNTWKMKSVKAVQEISQIFMKERKKIK